MVKKKYKFAQADIGPLEVTPRAHETQDKMIKRFIKKVRNEGVLQEVYLRKGYEKPSEKRRRKHLRSVFNSSGY